MLAVIVLLAACAPLFTINCIGGDDIIYHLLRIEALKEGILAGRPFLRINMLFFGGAGYASSMFYPDLLLYFPALLRAIGTQINLSFHLFVAMCIILGFASSYYCAKYVSGSDYAALATAVIFTLYQYHIDDIYTRSAVGEYTAVIFVPFVIAGLYDLLYAKYERPWMLFAGMTGVLLCHTITAVICVVLCLAFFLTGAGRLIKDRTLMLKLILTALAVLAVTAFYWIPVLEIMLQGVLSTDHFFDMEYESVKLWEMLFNKTCRMGAAVFLLLLIRPALKKKDRFADTCALSGIVLAAVSTSLLPWGRLQDLLGFMQFPWRVYVVTGPLLAFAEGCYIRDLAAELSGTDEERKETVMRLIVIVTTAIMLLSLTCNLQRNEKKYYSYSDDYFRYKPYTAEVIGGEWLPVAAADRDALTAGSDIARAEDGSEYNVERNKNELSVSGISSGAGYVDVPFVYYKGYAAEDSSGKRLAVSGEGDNGLTRVYTQGAESIRVWYAGTAAQHAGDAVSVLSVMLIAVWALIRRRKDIPPDKNG